MSVDNTAVNCIPRRVAAFPQVLNKDVRVCAFRMVELVTAGIAQLSAGSLAPSPQQDASLALRAGEYHRIPHQGGTFAIAHQVLIYDIPYSEQHQYFI